MSDDHHAEQAEVVGPGEAEEEKSTMVLDGSKLMRIASMTRAMLNEAREAPLDEAGRQRLTQIYERSLDELCSVLPDELRDELSEIFVPLQEGTVPSASELRIAQAQLVGWLEGLFNGIQAALFTQQMAARAQLEHMRQGPRAALEPGTDERQTGLYL